MLRRRRSEPRTLQAAGRTFKEVADDHGSTARIIDHIAGKGRHRSRIGALLVELPSAVRLHVGTGFIDLHRERPPQPGNATTFRYQELTEAGVQRFPSSC